MNSISDHWFDCCLYSPNPIFDAISLALNRIFQYDCIVTVVFLILIIFPILFKIYGFGLQQRLRDFYDSSRIVFINFLFLCSFSMAISTIVHLWIQQPMPCITWDGRSISPSKNGSRTPNEEIIVLLILVESIWSLKIGMAFLCKIISILLFGTHCYSSIISGYSSISQVCVSISLGLWIIFLIKFLPPIGLPIFGFFATAGVGGLFFVLFPKYKWDLPIIRESLQICLRSSIVLIASCILLIRFANARREFKWMRLSWGFGWGATTADVMDEVIVPSMIKEAPLDDFGNILTTDLIDGCVCFWIFLAGNTFLYTSDSRYRFMID